MYLFQALQLFSGFLGIPMLLMSGVANTPQAIAPPPASTSTDTLVSQRYQSPNAPTDFEEDDRVDSL